MCQETRKYKNKSFPNNQNSHMFWLVSGSPAAPLTLKTNPVWRLKYLNILQKIPLPSINKQFLGGARVVKEVQIFFFFSIHRCFYSQTEVRETSKSFQQGRSYLCSIGNSYREWRQAIYTSTITLQTLGNPWLIVKTRKVAMASLAWELHWPQQFLGTHWG